MPTPRKQPLPAPTSPFFPASIPYLLVLCRSATRMTEFLATQEELIKAGGTQVRKFHYPDDVMAWKDRQQDCHLIILERPDDPIFFREEVGRVKLFFRNTIMHISS